MVLAREDDEQDAPMMSMTPSMMPRRASDAEARRAMTPLGGGDVERERARRPTH